MSEDEERRSLRRKINIKLEKRLRTKPLNDTKTVKLCEQLQKNIQEAKHLHPSWLPFARSVRNTCRKRQYDAKVAAAVEAAAEEEAEVEAAAEEEAENVTNVSPINAIGRSNKYVRQDTLTKAPRIAPSYEKNPSIPGLPKPHKEHTFGTTPIVVGQVNRRPAFNGRHAPAKGSLGAAPLRQTMKNGDRRNDFASAAARHQRIGEIALGAAVENSPTVKSGGPTTVHGMLSTTAHTDEIPAPLNSVVEHISTEDDIAAQLKDLEARHTLCVESCNAIKLEADALNEFKLKKKIDGISMKRTDKLIDFLCERILDPSKDWAAHIDTLVHIPHSLTGAGYLRGGDYFEALFQIAIAIGVLPMFRGKFIKFHDVEGYAVMRDFPNYLYEKTILNSGGGEQGVSDITFQVSNSSDFEKHKSPSYKCGSTVSDDVFSNNPVYFISVKGFKKEKSPAKEYDIPILDLQLSIFPSITHKYIMVCVKNKRRFMEKLSRIQMDMLKHRIHAVIGYDEIIELFTTFRVDFFTRIGTSTPTSEERRNQLLSLFPINEVVMPALSLYFHQELVVESVMARINKVRSEGDRITPHYLCIGVLPRGGKSFIAGGIIQKYREYRKHLHEESGGFNVLFLTSAVNETRSQFKEDLIKKFTEFRDFNFVDLVNITPDHEGPHLNNFYFMSRQLSTTSTERIEDEENPDGTSLLVTLERKLTGISGKNIDVCFFDEAHIGITATSVRKNFDEVFNKFPGVPIILMTATYSKPSAILSSNDDLFIWDLQDIKDMRSLPALGMDEFIRSSPDVLNRYPAAEGLLKRRIALGESLERLATPYAQFAMPAFISLTLAPPDVQSMIHTGAGYDAMKPFELRTDKPLDKPLYKPLLMDVTRSDVWGNKLLKNQEDAINILDFLTPELDESDAPPSIKLIGPNRRFRALNQIFHIAQTNGCRPFQGRPFSILMFLPFRAKNSKEDKPGIRIGELCRVWASWMRTRRYWRDKFVFLTLSKYEHHTKTSKMDDSVLDAVTSGIVHRDNHPKYDLKTLIRTVEQEALKQDKGLVILSGDVAKMGISLPCVDVVCMMGNNSDADDIIQKMYRALTDDPPDKKFGFIVDLNAKRIVRAMFDYDLQKDKMRTSNVHIPTVEERAMKLFNLCDWGQSGFIEDNSSNTMTDVMDRIKKRIVDNLKQVLFDEKNIAQIKRKQEDEFKILDTTFVKRIREALYGTVAPSGKSKSTKATILLKRGNSIPGVLSGPSPGPGPGGVTAFKPSNANGSESGAAAAPLPTISEEDAKKRMFEIIQTVINTLVMRSSDTWSGDSGSLNIVSLMKRYHEDKRAREGALSMISRAPACECHGARGDPRDTRECKTPHTNLYDLVYCELKAFAHNEKQKFSMAKHLDIITLAEEALALPLPEWNIYIESLLADLKNVRQSGGYRKPRRAKITRKNRRRHVQRKTVQRSSRNH